jgi:DNA-binding transcriptional MerR regulator
MDEKQLVKITDLSTMLELSSRSLRYYEQVGLIKSVRPAFEKYRFFDAENIERLKQIIVLRKMQIPVKDIIRIYGSSDMSVVVETFVNRIRSIEDEIDALAELKRIVSDFLQTMLDNGITKISAIPILYEEMDKQVALMRERKPTSFAELENLSDKLVKPLDMSIVDLEPCRVLTSFRKPGTKESDFSGFSRYIQMNGLSQASSGSHRQFEFQTEAGDVMMVRVPEEFVNDSGYLDYTFAGGLFAAVNVYLDEDLGQRFRTLVSELDANPYYQFAYCADGTSRHPVLLENLISPDDKRDLVSMLIPIKKRLPDASLFDPPREVADISLEEIEEANPVLWAVDVPLDKLTPVNSPHYRVLENGEAEYTGWISTRVLNTNVTVKLPFRVDIEFRCETTGERFSYGDSEASIIFYHGGELSYPFGINMGNRRDIPEEALRFHQPIFKNRYNFNGRGRINKDEYNQLTWIVGEKHFAVFVNGELRYCGVNFPYMERDLNREAALPVIIGSNGQGMKYFRKIQVSQLIYMPKNKKRGISRDHQTEQQHSSHNPPLNYERTRRKLLVQRLCSVCHGMFGRAGL